MTPHESMSAFAYGLMQDIYTYLEARKPTPPSDKDVDGEWAEILKELDLLYPD